MITVKFFASLREELRCERLAFEWRDNFHVGDLLNELKQRGDAWESALSSPNLLVAVNQHHADLSMVLSKGDEVAFFPPVTGG